MSIGLERFVEAQKKVYHTALNEIRSGCKHSHWMWYIFPQIAGLGHSAIAKKYEIIDLQEAKEYLLNPYLRENLIRISHALLECDNENIEEIMGFPDNLKLCSSMTLFELAGPEIEEFRLVLEKYFDGVRDKRTLKILSKQTRADV